MLLFNVVTTFGPNIWKWFFLVVDNLFAEYAVCKPKPCLAVYLRFFLSHQCIPHCKKLMTTYTNLTLLHVISGLSIKAVLTS